MRPICASGRTTDTFSRVLETSMGLDCTLCKTGYLGSAHDVKFTKCLRYLKAQKEGGMIRQLMGS